MTARSPHLLPISDVVDQASPRIHVVINGMHRSGTSLVARIISLLGVSLGSADDLLGPGDDNRAGYFENRAIKTFADVVLAHLGGSWDRPPRLEPGWERDPSLGALRDEGQTILRDAFGDEVALGHRVGFKDPRASILLPFWRTVAPIDHSVVLVRHPGEVAASLAARRFAVEPDVAASLWLRYLLAALHASPDALVLRHRDPFDEPDLTVARLVTALELSEPDPTVMDQIRAHIDPTLFHQRASATQATDMSPLERLAFEVWNDGDVALDALDDNVADAIAQGRLQAFGDLDDVAQSRADAASLKSQLKARNAQVRALERQIAALRRDTATSAKSGAAATAMDADAPVDSPQLVVPPELSLAPMGAQRLRSTLAMIDTRYDALCAPATVIPPGSSITTDTLRRAIHPEPLRPLLTTNARGAIAVRTSGAASVVDATSVDFSGLTEVFEDRSVPAHLVWQMSELADAVDEGRPPFPSSTVVVFLGTIVDDDVDDIARGWVNDLVRLGVEARLAIVAPPPGLHLSGPCSPTVASLNAIRPDVVVALDDGALAMVNAWAPSHAVVCAMLSQDCVDNVVVTPNPGALGTNASVGRRSTGREIQELTARLASGPWAVHPAAPHTPLPDDDDVPAAVAPARNIAIVADMPGARFIESRLVGEALESFGEAFHLPFTVASGLAGIRRVGRFATDVAVTAAGGGNASVDRRVAARIGAGLTTVCWVHAADIVADRDATHGIARLQPLAHQRVTEAGLAVVPSPAAQRYLSDLGVTSAVAPLALRASMAERLALIGATPRRGAPVIGWIIDPGGAAPAPSTPAIAEAVVALLADDPSIRVEIVAPRGWTHEQLAANSRVTIATNAPAIATVGRWWGQIWSPSSRQVRVLGQVGPLVEAAAAGLPTVMTHADAAHAGLLTDPALLIRDRLDPDEWRSHITAICDATVRSAAADRTQQLADARLGASGRIELARTIVTLAGLQ